MPLSLFCKILRYSRMSTFLVIHSKVGGCLHKLRRIHVILKIFSKVSIRGSTYFNFMK